MKLIPREERFFSLLGELIGKVHGGAGLLVELLNDYERRVEHAARIKLVEEECDDLVAEVVAKLNASFITPLDREDLYLLGTRCDDIMDEINGLARRLEFSHAVPLRPDVFEMAGLLEEGLGEVEAAFGQLKGRNGVTEHAQRVRRVERRGDVLYADALHRLFTEEPQAIEVIKWVAIYEQLEDSIDRCKHLAELLESIVVKHT